MQLNRVVLQNFRQHADTRIEFGPGVTGIIGPNGAGKTTILEAIAWALYGNPAARGTRDSIRFNRSGARSGVRVELDFELGGHNYRVVRGLTNAELYLDGPENKIANSITGVTDYLVRRLGMTREEFFNTYFTGQKELSVMAAMSPTERAQFLSRVLGYERLRAAQELVRDRRRAIVAEMAGLKQGMGDPDAIARQVAEAETRLEQARDRARFAERRRDASAIGARRSAAPLGGGAARARGASGAPGRPARRRAGGGRRASRGAATRARPRRRRERAGRAGRVACGARAVSAHRVRASAPRGAVARGRPAAGAARDPVARSPRTSFGFATAGRSSRTRRRSRRRSMRALVAKRAEFEATDGLLEARRTEWVRDRQEAETKRQSLREQYVELKEQRDRIVSLGAEGTCPTCARPLGETLSRGARPAR